MHGNRAGSVGRILPVFDDPISADNYNNSNRPDIIQSHQHQHQQSRSSSNLPVVPPGSPPYQLPPPRMSTTPLRFGSDPFLPQRIPPPGKHDTSTIHPLPVVKNDPLPSVSQLLTHTSSSDSSHPAFGAAHSPGQDYSHRFHHHHHHSHSHSHSSSSVKTSQDFGLGKGKKSIPVPSPESSGINLQQTEKSLPPLLTHVALQDSPTGVGPRFSPAVNDNAVLPRQQHVGTGPSDHPDNTPLVPHSNDNTNHNSSNQSQTQPIRLHVVDERYVDGEGLCYIYADGSHCPKSIDGMPVNANWGITKAGKPRKRLAQACLTCREKKIKCQPNLDRCEQCQRSGRDCRFESAPRGNRASVKAQHVACHSNGSDTKSRHSSSPHRHSCSPTPLYSMTKASNGSTTSLQPPPPPIAAAGPNSPPSVSRTPLPPLPSSAVLVDSTQNDVRMDDAEQDHENYTRTEGLINANNDKAIIVPDHHAGYSMKPPLDGRIFSEPKACASSLSTSPGYSEQLMGMKDIDPEDPLTNDWNTDPYETDPESTSHYIESYFTHVNDTLYYVFPRARFILWLKSCRTKSLADKMLLYSMMTLGTVFSDRSDKATASRRYSRTARYASEHSQHDFTLQLAQTRIILSLWYYAIGALVKAWDSIGAAVRTVCGLRYNIESGGVTSGQAEDCEYGLHPQALIECRRRTFWVAFLIERLSSLYSPSSIFIPSQTALLRLPCREEIYEAQEYGTAPYFQDFLNQAPPSSAEEEDLSGLSPMAFLIGIVSLWSEVSQHVFYSPHIPAKAYGRLFKEFHATIVRRTEEWAMKLPVYLTFTVENLKRCISARKLDAFVSVHLMYHVTLMKLNRYARYPNLPSGTVDQYIHNARYHAIEILRICYTLHHLPEKGEEKTEQTKEEKEEYQRQQQLPKTSHLNPFLGYVILASIDVLSAAGLTTDLPDNITLLKAGLDTIGHLNRNWTGSLFLAPLIETRVESLRECLRRHGQGHGNTETGTGVVGKLGFVLDGTPLHTRVRVGAPRQHPTGAINQDLLYGGLPRERLMRALGLDVEGGVGDDVRGNVSGPGDFIVCVRDEE